MKSEAALAVSYLRRTGQGDLYVGVPRGGTSRVHLPDDDARARFVTALLKAKCEPGEELEMFGESVASMHGANDVLRGLRVTFSAARNTRSSVHSAGATALRMAAAVAARYSAPESTCRKPSTDATHCAVDDLPDAAGPSIAMTIRAAPDACGLTRLPVRGPTRIRDRRPRRSPDHRP